MEPLHNPSNRAPHANIYAPRRSRWPGLLGAAAIVAAVLGVTMWAQHDDARKAGAPLDKGASATIPTQPGIDNADANASSTPPSDGSTVATQPSPQRQ